jgi:UDP-3-O-[3-hydroxymyristoyl] glucosamine N-acyltransferase
MPTLLEPHDAPALHDLLAQANVAGLDCRILDREGRPEPHIRGIGSLRGAGPGEISFLSDRKLSHQLPGCGADAVIMTASDHDAMKHQQLPYWVVLCSQPYLMYALLAQWFDRRRVAAIPAGIHPTAVIAADAHIAENVGIGPHCVIEAGARVGAGSRLGAGCFVGQGSSVGRQCLLHARVTLYHQVVLGDRAIVHSGVVLGADGFGFAPDPRNADGGWAKIAQLGGVRVGDDVEIGANTTIDRGAIDSTTIGNGVKLDNQIMIAHNVNIGDNTAIAACVGIAGSTTIGRRCIIGGASMISGHLVLADDVHVSGGTAVTTSVNEPGRYTGVYPFAEHKQWQRNAAVVSQLAQLRRRVRQHEKSSRSD